MAEPRSVVTALLQAPGQPARGQQRELAITVATGARAGLSVRFGGEALLIGSSARGGLVLDDVSVSRHHARIELRGDQLMIRDLGSTNGTYVDGLRVEAAYLPDRARVRLGTTELVTELLATTAGFEVHATTQLGRLHGASTAMRRLFATLERVAATDATVLLEGESGTGKELIAEALHGASRRAKAPFVVVDCGSLPATLIESELFGHDKGAFTGAITAREGAFEQADGGTIFLDEIGELDAALQPRLLRVLDSRKVKRLGEAHYRDVDVRVIAATNRDLAAMVTAGDFREDLYHRLAVVELVVPPLRERREDIEMLARRFADEVCEREPMARRDALTPDVLASLRGRSWRGNVRELRNLVERIVLLAGLDPPVAEPAPVASETEAATEAASEAATEAAIARWPYARAREHTLEEFERSYVTRLLDRSGGNVAQAARLADMERTYLFKLIRKHKLRS